MYQMRPWFFFVALLGFANAYNYLVYCPLYAHSHHVFLAEIADTLTNAGHNVTFLAPIIIRKFENVKYLKSTKDIIYIQPDEELEAMAVSANYSKFWVEDPSVLSMVPSVRIFMAMFNKNYEYFKSNPQVLDELKARKFDALIFEITCPTGFPIAEYLNVRTLIPTLSMTYQPMISRAIGEPAPLTALPSIVAPFGDRMSFGQRLMNTLGEFVFFGLINPPPMYSFKYPYKPIDVPAAIIKSPFIFTNANPYLDFPRPLLTKSILIGGISVNVTQMREKKLPEEFDRILSERKENVLISFGSMILSKDMPDVYKKTIVQVIDSFPEVTFIWKYEEEDVSFAGSPKNLHFSKWVPQTALLADSRLSAFVTHGGLGSVTELSYLGKPAILIPLFSDQYKNAKMLSRHNGSIALDKRDLADYSKLRSAVHTILSDKSYTTRAETLGLQLENQPVSPHELLVKHVEFGTRFGELPSLDPYSRQMSFFTFYMIDIILFLGAIILLFFFSLFWITRRILRCVFQKKEKQL